MDCCLRDGSCMVRGYEEGRFTVHCMRVLVRTAGLFYLELVLTGIEQEALRAEHFGQKSYGFLL